MKKNQFLQFIWPAVVEGNYLDAARKRCLLAMCFFAAAVGFLSGTRNFEESFAAYPIQTLIAVIAPLVLLVCPIALAITNNLRAIAWFFLGFTFLGLISVPLIAGGMFSRSTFFFLPWVMMATLFLGWKEGIGAAILVGLVYFTLHNLRSSIAPTIVEFDTDTVSTWLIAALGMTLVIMTSSAAIFQREMEMAANNLSEARAEAEAANQAKSDFLAKMSHEIRTPMNGIIGMAELLEASELSEQQSVLVDTITASSESLLTIINDILDLSKIEAGHIDLVEKTFELKPVVQNLAALFSLRLEGSGLELTVEYDDSLPPIYLGDADRIRQILINLVGNALKFTEQGRVRIDVNGASQNDSVALSFAVNDTGIGIAPDKLDEIFKSFAQAESSKTRRFDGVGLGLAIARQLARTMGGDIKVQSISGKGSTFTFEVSLPVASAPVSKPRLQQSIATALDAVDTRESSKANASPIKVLAADDNEVNRLVLRSLIDRHRFDLTFAINGRQAVEKAQAQKFDIILMDVSMPELNGYDACRAIRQLESQGKLERTPIVCLTAHALDGERERSLEAGMDDYLAKPIRKDQIGAMLQKWAPKNSTTAPSRKVA